MIFYHKTFSPDSLTGAELDHYLAMGWYRMHQNLFTTTHLLAGDCWRVHWMRFPLMKIVQKAAHGRMRKRNRSFNVTIDDFAGVPTDHEELYRRYRESIDFNGAFTIQQALLGEPDANKNIFMTKCISISNGGRLIAGGYFDLGKNSAASILHFFDPAYKRYSLGKYLMLLTVDFLKSRDYEFYYPGYVIAGSAKMDYKLFLGKEAGYYYDPETQTWGHFKDSILLPEVYTESDKLKVITALLADEALGAKMGD